MRILNRHKKFVSVKTLSFCCLFALAQICCAQPEITIPKKPRNKGIKILPIAFYLPETSIGAGVLAYKLFRVSKSDTVSRKSNFQSYASYTLNKQFALENEWQIFTKKENYVFSGKLDYTRFPEYFYGIGNFTPESGKELYSFDMIRFQSKNVKHLGKKIFVGIQYDLQYLFNMKKDEFSMMIPSNVSGTEGYFVSGIGGVVISDTRNNVLNSSKGHYAEVLFSVNDKITFSKYNYTTVSVDLRKYFTVANRYTFALHGYGNFNSGTVPFRAMPAIGGARYLRGYYRGRFRDNNLIVFQGEARIPLFWRIGIVGFGGIGQVSDKVNNFRSDAFKYDYGGGIRYNINKKDNVNIRLDWGFTNEGNGLYIVFAEAF